MNRNEMRLVQWEHKTPAASSLILFLDLCSFKMLKYNIIAGMAELADALDLGSSAARRGGSTPLVRTTLTSRLSYGELFLDE